MKDLDEILPSETPRRPRAELVPVDEILTRLPTLLGSTAHRRERLIDFAERMGMGVERVDGFTCLPRGIFDALETDRWRL